MYSVKLINGRFLVSSVLNSGAYCVVDFLFDTGAKNTVISDKNLRGLTLNKTGRRTVFKSVSGDELGAYEGCVQQMTIGTIDIGKTNIWIVDRPYTLQIPLLGMYVLQKLSFNYDANAGILTFAGARTEKSNREHLCTMCSNIGVSVDKIEPLLPDSWEQLSYDELLKTVRFAWNTFYLNRDKE